MEVKASLKYARIGTQKARLVADVIRGKNINEAIRALSFIPKKSAPLFKKLLESAVANAETKELIDIDLLYVKTVTVDQGPSLRRYKPAPQGRSKPIRKKMSHFHVVLSEKQGHRLSKKVQKPFEKVLQNKTSSIEGSQIKPPQKKVENHAPEAEVEKITNFSEKSTIEEEKTIQKKGEDGSKS